MVRRVVLGGGVPLVGPQEELSGPSGYTPRGFTSSPKGRRSKDFWGLQQKTNKQTNQTDLKSKKTFVTRFWPVGFSTSEIPDKQTPSRFFYWPTDWWVWVVDFEIQWQTRQGGWDQSTVLVFNVRALPCIFGLASANNQFWQSVAPFQMVFQLHSMGHVRKVQTGNLGIFIKLWLFEDFWSVPGYNNNTEIL